MHWVAGSGSYCAWLQSLITIENELSLQCVLSMLHQHCKAFVTPHEAHCTQMRLCTSSNRQIAPQTAVSSRLYGMKLVPNVSHQVHLALSAVCNRRCMAAVRTQAVASGKGFGQQAQSASEADTMLKSSELPERSMGPVHVVMAAGE